MGREQISNQSKGPTQRLSMGEVRVSSLSSIWMEFEPSKTEPCISRSGQGRTHDSANYGMLMPQLHIGS